MTENQALSATTQQINAYYRGIDESHKWPICNRFDVTEIAIKRLRKSGLFNGGLEYFMALDSEIGQIVNSQI